MRAKKIKWGRPARLKSCQSARMRRDHAILMKWVVALVIGALYWLGRGLGLW